VQFAHLVPLPLAEPVPHTRDVDCGGLRAYVDVVWPLQQGEVGDLVDLLQVGEAL
jgi:hypothetical protein